MVGEQACSLEGCPRTHLEYFYGGVALFRPEGWREVRLILAQGLAERFRR